MVYAHDQSKFGDMNWMKACNGISHELWSKLGSAVKAIINDKDKNIDPQKLNEENIETVIKILKEERHLAIEERHYLRSFYKEQLHLNQSQINHRNVKCLQFMITIQNIN